MTDNSIDYYIAREARERTLAAAAMHPVIADIHFEMADRYHALIADAKMLQSMRGAFRIGERSRGRDVAASG